MAIKNGSTLIHCLKQSFMFRNLNVGKKISSWKLLFESFVFFALTNFFLSIPNVGVLKRLCPSSSVPLEILCLLIYTTCATLAIFFVLFVVGFAIAVVLFVNRKRYRFIEVTNTLVFSRDSLSRRHPVRTFNLRHRPVQRPNRAISENARLHSYSVLFKPLHFRHTFHNVSLRCSAYHGSRALYSKSSIS